MIVYRLTLPQYANDLSGIGASIYGGRWNSIGSFVLYAAQSSSLSILEHLVHMHGAKSDSKYLLTLLDVGSSLVEEVPTNISDFRDQKSTQAAGDAWLSSKASPILKVSSIINPLESNYLINPTHPDLDIEIKNQEWFVYDDRLVRNSNT